MQLISCLILIVSDCVWVILCWVIWPWLIWPWLIWFTSTWLILGWLIMEWLEVMWLIRTAVTSGCEWIGLLLNWFPKAVWPSFDGNELWMVQKSQPGSYQVKFEGLWLFRNKVNLPKLFHIVTVPKKVDWGQMRSNFEPMTLVKLFSNFLHKYLIQFVLRIFVTIHKMLWNQNDRWMLRFPSLSPKLLFSCRLTAVYRVIYPGSKRDHRLTQFF